MAKLIGDVAPFDVTEVAHPAHEFLAEWIVVRGSRPDVPDTRRLARLLRARRERPRSGPASNHFDEVAPSHTARSGLTTTLILFKVQPSRHLQRPRLARWEGRG